MQDIIEEEPTLIQWYIDGDSDGFGNPDINLGMMAELKPNGFVRNNEDCDDSDSSINPRANEDDYDGIDSNCDGINEVAIQTFSKTYGTNEYETGSFIFDTPDGGFLTAGSQYSPTVNNFIGSYSFWVVKFDIEGNLEWEKSYGGPNDDSITVMKETADGGYIMGGGSTSEEGNVQINYGNSDWWVVKIDSSGNIQWVKTFGGSKRDNLEDIIVTESGNYLLAGGSWSSDEDFKREGIGSSSWFVMLENDGNVLWKSHLDKRSVSSIIKLTDGTFFAAGHSEKDLLLYRIEASGAILWTKIINTEYRSMRISSMILGPDNSIFIGGYIYSGVIEQDYWLLNLTQEGDINWSKEFNGDRFDNISSITLSKDKNSYFITGYEYNSDNNENEAWLANYNLNGDLSWKKSFGGSNFDILTCFSELESGGFLVSGFTKSMDGDIIDKSEDNSRDLWILKLKPNGEF
ncbi:putative metal-binding motif-containing protein [Tamlana sp. s12]|uniref:putative metal-binding motif-containing protein n=1 Tax=Tamlana sp. s12 TaxID=1630406 RepID=UPI000A8CC8D1|nr:putative metal-binding motif-containing protein [Tamlana sp. s12]QQY81470.1 putative metal-binding motif-containing protein [Tamlana sp. s12]